MSHLSKEQRHTIYVLTTRGLKQKDIANAVGKDKSVISRELKRNKNDKGKYSFSYAQMCVDVRKERYTRTRMFSETIQKVVKDYLENDDWSPEQIVGFCRKNGIQMVSHERIYQYIRRDKKNGRKAFRTLPTQAKTSKTKKKIKL